ncbi:hypothetical protein FRB94_012770 [Tulasnella sp. JGI-2019a]|nr:hypothetical protein FRB94_012770 [Tulasnella sp. JGI-2019a]
MNSTYLPLSPPRSPRSPTTPSTRHFPRNSQAESGLHNSRNAGPKGSITRTPSSMDPFSASSKATQPPPLYQWRSPPQTPDRTMHTTNWTQLPTPPTEQRPAFSGPSSPSPRRTLSKRSQEARIWEDALENAVMGPDASGEIDLQNQNLTYIPPFITDLDKLVILPIPSESILQERKRTFGRVRSAPMYRISSKRTLARSPTISKMLGPNLSHSRTASMDEDEKVTEVHLLLGSNTISKLPSEIFRIRGLTVLSLRNNRLTRLPAAISELVNLEELNLSNNRLEYLPSETLLIGLKKLFLNANPFVTPPIAETGIPGSRILGPLNRLREGVVSLREITLRVLFSRPTAISGSQTKALHETVLQTIYELPIPANTLSADLLAKINPSLPSFSRSHPASLPPSRVSSLQLARPSTSSRQPLLPSAMSETLDLSTADDDPRLNDAYYDAKFNKCPNTTGIGEGFRRCGELIFFDHAEERMEWVSSLAEDVVSDLKGGLVPILWRGCSAGCLDFLNAGDDASKRNDVPVLLDGANVAILGDAVAATDEEWDSFELDP